MSDTAEDLKWSLFTVEYTRIAAQVQHACTLATGLEGEEEAFNRILEMLDHCREQTIGFRDRPKDGETDVLFDAEGTLD